MVATKTQVQSAARSVVWSYSVYDGMLDYGTTPRYEGELHDLDTEFYPDIQDAFTISAPSADEGDPSWVKLVLESGPNTWYLA